MKKEDFYKQYANLPMPKRVIGHRFDKDGITHALSLFDMYRLICSLDDEQRKKNEEMDKYLLIAEKLMQ